MQTGHAPEVVFEILSEETWKDDLTKKPVSYAQMGVKEYVAYDPHEPAVARGRSRRLFGWKLDAERGEMVLLWPNQEGRVWSAELESWLGADEEYLRLYDRDGHLRLTEAEAQAKRVEVEVEARQVAIRRAEAEARRANALAEKLRALGINPDEI